MLTPTAAHQHALATLIDETSNLRGNLFHDARIVVLMREHGVARIVTRDRGFHSFSGVEVTDPPRMMLLSRMTPP